MTLRFKLEDVCLIASTNFYNVKKFLMLSRWQFINFLNQYARKEHQNAANDKYDDDDRIHDLHCSYT
jgi:hypothetical protein